MIGLADCNNFFVSCERTLNPALERHPVVVLSNNDGCVVARSNEAKRLGIKMGEPAFKIRDLLTSGQVIALSGNHILYREISIRIHNIFRRFAPSQVDYSVDEAFLEMDGIPDSELPVIGEAICNTCWQEEHIPITIGFAPSKTLAKVATEVGKKSGRRVVMLTDPVQIQEILHKMPIHDLWGIGRRLTKRMYLQGVHTVGQFADKDLYWVRAQMGVVGERSWLELHGTSCIELDFKSRKIQDSISETRTFPEDIDDFDYLRARIAIYCSHVAKRLRAMNGVCGELAVFLRTNRFHTEAGYYAPMCSAKFEPRTSDTPALTAAAVDLLDRIFNPAFKYKRAGVILSDIQPFVPHTPSLFDSEDIEGESLKKSSELMKTVDRLNKGVGPNVIKLASELTQGTIGHNDGYSSSFGAPKEE